MLFNIAYDRIDKDTLAIKVYDVYNDGLVIKMWRVDCTHRNTKAKHSEVFKDFNNAYAFSCSVQHEYHTGIYDTLLPEHRG